MRVNYHGILNLEKVGFYYLGNLPWYCFITLAPGANAIKQFSSSPLLIQTNKLECLSWTTLEGKAKAYPSGAELFAFAHK